jgi:hypothetical protein
MTDLRCMVCARPRDLQHFTTYTFKLPEENVDSEMVSVEDRTASTIQRKVSFGHQLSLRY